MSHCEDLATMLLRNWPGASLEGMHFSDFLPESESDRAVELLRDYHTNDCESQHGVIAQAFHTRLVDSCASQFRTEVFHVRYTTWDGSTRHLIGLRDFTDQGSLALSRADAAEAVDLCPMRPMSTSPRPSRPQPATPSGVRGHGFDASIVPDLLNQTVVTAAEDPLLVAAQQKLNLLEIDTVELVIDSASASVAFLAGKQVS